VLATINNIRVVSLQNHSIDKRKYNILLWCLVLFILVCVIVVWYVKLSKESRDSALSSTCKNRLKLISLALSNYSMKHGCFPPAYICDKRGKPVNSWRILIAPYFWYTFPSAEYDFTKSWTDQKRLNARQLQIGENAFEEFHCPSANNQRLENTNYVAVVGPNTMWPGREPAKPAADGSDKDKILLIEIVNSDILWMEPRDLTLEQALDAIQPKTGIGIGSHHKDGIHYLTVGGEVKSLPHNIDRESLRKLLVRDSLIDDKEKASDVGVKKSEGAILVSPKTVSPKNTSSPSRNTDKGSDGKKRSDLPPSNGGSE
jgi:hypothetical protein